MIILSVAAESDEMFNRYGEDRYFLSCEKTKEAAKENLYSFLCKEYEYFEYEFDISNSDVEEIIINLSIEDFPEIAYLQEKDIVEISEELYEEILSGNKY